MIRKLYDFTGNNLNSAPKDGQVYFSYYNGAVSQYHVNQTEFQKQFPYPPYARGLIDVTGEAADKCSVVDVEAGDVSQGTAIQWIQSYKKIHPGSLGTVYCDRATFAEFVPAAAAAGQVVGKDYQVWLATLDGVRPTAPPVTGVVAVQWKDWGLYDESVVFADTWHPTPNTPVLSSPVPPVLIGHVVYIQQGFRAVPGDVATKPVESHDNGKTWT